MLTAIEARTIGVEDTIPMIEETIRAVAARKSKISWKTHMLTPAVREVLEQRGFEILPPMHDGSSYSVISWR